MTWAIQTPATTDWLVNPSLDGAFTASAFEPEAFYTIPDNWTLVEPATTVWTTQPA